MAIVLQRLATLAFRHSWEREDVGWLVVAADVDHDTLDRAADEERVILR